MKSRILFYILLIVALETVAMSCFRQSLTDSRFFVGGILFYAAVGFMLCETFKMSGLAMTNALWSGLSVLATTLAGVIIFKEVLHFHDFVAITFISCGVLILKLTR